MDTPIYKMVNLKLLFALLLRSRGKASFLNYIPKNAKVLDVGCGNNSPFRVKSKRPDIFYVGLDVGNYNQKANPNCYADRYIIVSSKDFVEEIKKFCNSFDAIISSHNLEHCERQDEVLDAMLKALKKGGKIYLSFPCEESINFPKRRDTLNFYDDPTHLRMLNFNKTIDKIKSNSLVIDFAVKRYRPFILFMIGLILEPFAFILKRNMPFGSTGAFYGFETIIWASRIG
jgi:SAM-dependent methyltransferase